MYIIFIFLYFFIFIYLFLLLYIIFSEFWVGTGHSRFFYLFIDIFIQIKSYEA